MEVGDETITATTNHPFYVVGFGYKAAEELNAGEEVLLLNGETKAICSVTLEHLKEPVPVYNFEVEDWHTYYVSGQGVLVHNNNRDCSVGGSSNDGGEPVSTPNSGKEKPWKRMTSKESSEAAKKLGYEKTKYRAKNGEPIYYNRKTKTYISQDIGSADGSGPHNGGVWKMAKSPEGINSKASRLGTYDANLNRIGD